MLNLIYTFFEVTIFLLCYFNNSLLYYVLRIDIRLNLKEKTKVCTFHHEHFLKTSACISEYLPTRTKKSKIELNGKGQKKSEITSGFDIGKC